MLVCLGMIIRIWVQSLIFEKAWLYLGCSNMFVIVIVFFPVVFDMVPFGFNFVALRLIVCIGVFSHAT